MDDVGVFAPACPVPTLPIHITMGHGGGGRLTQQLLEQVFLPAFRNEALDARHDGAILPGLSGRMAFTTDAHVVSPMFFPGGDIGTLAVNGTVNDLAMCGARPLYLSVAFILEEGLEIETLRRVAISMGVAARAAGVQLVTGDTKVVDRGKGDGIFITTTGVGVIEHSLQIGPAQVRAGDAVVLSGDIGRHGMAIMAAREGLAFETTLESDCACLFEPVQALIDAGVEVHCLRDLTRGGLATALVEIAQTGGLRVHIREDAIPVPEEVAGACEILGLDPLYVANEGRFVAFMPEDQAERALEVLRAHPLSSHARKIGEVRDEVDALVTMTSLIGSTRILDLLTGEQLPRIC